MACGFHALKAISFGINGLGELAVDLLQPTGVAHRRRGGFRHIARITLFGGPTLRLAASWYPENHLRARTPEIIFRKSHKVDC